MKQKTPTSPLKNFDLVAVAACSFAVHTSDSNGAWQQILPGQDFTAYDGRPKDVSGGKWRINNKSGSALAATLNANADAGDKLLFDYEHQTLLTKQNGQKAPASGRADAFEWREGEGLFARLHYTPTAKKHVEDGEYSHFSPVILYNENTGDVLGLHSVALTNDPAVKGMSSAALSFSAADIDDSINDPNAITPPETPMDKTKLALLFSLFGLTAPDTDDKSVIAALSADNFIDAIKAAKTKLSANDELTTKVATLTAQVNESVSPAEFVPREIYDNLVVEMAALSANVEQLSVDQVIEQARDDGKFVAQAELTYLKDLGNSNLAALKSTLDKRPVTAALKSKQTDELDANAANNNSTKVASLSAEQASVAKQLGMSNDEYLAQINGA